LKDCKARLDERFCPHHGFTRADIIRAFKYEEAKTISDFLSRRTTIVYSSCMGRDCIHEVSKTLKEFLDWDEDKLRRQNEGYLKELELNQSFRR
jgi:glycerol-3-phosphate dehydrogenase